MLYVASHGTFDATRAGLVLRAAIAARKAGVGARVALLGGAIALMKPSTARRTVTVAVPSTSKPKGLESQKRTLQSLIDEAKGLGVICYC
jgi:hypothetical protein